MPTTAIPKAFCVYSINTDDDPICDRNRLDIFDWRRRQEMACSSLASGQSVYAIAPFGQKFIIFPKRIKDETKLLAVWDGLKMDFEDPDTVPWPDQAAEAVAEFILAKIRRHVDKNLALATVADQAYKTRRRDLYLEEKEKLSAEAKDEETVSGEVAPPAVGNASGWDPTITSLADLAAVATVNLSPPVIRAWINSEDGTEQVWRLIASAAATDEGIQRPNDFDALTNAKVWVKAST